MMMRGVVVVALLVAAVAAAGCCNGANAASTGRRVGAAVQLLSMQPRQAAPANASCGVRIQYEYGCSEPRCADLKVGFLNYLYFHECIMEKVHGLSFVILGFGFLFLLILLESTTDHYFVVAIKLAVLYLQLSPAVAGVTFLSIGNGASDVFSSIAAFASGAPKIGIGTLVGAALFVSTVVVGAVATVGDVRLQRAPFVREVVFLGLAVGYLYLCMHDSHVGGLEIAGFFILYGLFLCVVIAIKVYNDRTAPPKASTTAAVTKQQQQQQEQEQDQEAAVRTMSHGAKFGNGALDDSDADSGGRSSPMTRERSRSDGLALKLATAARQAGAQKQHQQQAATAAHAGEHVVMGTAASSTDGNGDPGSPAHPPMSPAVRAMLPSTLGGRARSFSTSSVHTLKNLGFVSEPKEQLLGKGGAWTESFWQVMTAGEGAAGSESQGLLSAGAGNTDGTRRGIASGPSAGAGAGAGAGADAEQHRAVRDPFRASTPVPQRTTMDMLRRAESGNGGVGHSPYGTTGSEQLHSAASMAKAAADSPRGRCRRCGASTRKYLLNVKHVAGPLVKLLELPFTLLRRLCIPLVEPDTWTWYFTAMTPLFGILLCGFVVFTSTMTLHVTKRIRVWQILLVVGCLLSIVSFFTVPRKRPPTGIALLVWVIYSFATSIVWILVIADELVGIAATFGLLLGMSNSMVGLTILAIGNSVNDLAADVTIARQGFASMAIAGAFAGPMFNILAGLGVPLLVMILKTGHVSLGSDNLTINFSLLSMLGFTVFIGVVVAARGFVIGKGVGAALLVLYTVFFIVLVILQTHM